MTIYEAISDIQLRLGHNSDDGKIPRGQIRHWINIERSKILKEDIKENGVIDPAMQTEYKCQLLQKEEYDCDCGFRWFLNLPGSVLDLQGDAGVQVYRMGGKAIEPQGSVGMNALLSKTRFNNKKSWYRVGEKLIFNGTYAENFEVDLYLILSDISGLDEPTQLPISAGLDSKLLESVEKIGRRELGIPFDYSNDGVDEKENIR